VAGNLIGAAIARVYYPASERTVSDTINDGLTISVEGIVGAEVIEFWPDIARHYKRKHDEKVLGRVVRATRRRGPKPVANRLRPPPAPPILMNSLGMALSQAPDFILIIRTQSRRCAAPDGSVGTGMILVVDD
jgi:hypothetical protein